MYLDGETPSVIGEDLTIEGQAITIRCKGALEINGKIHAELHSQKLVVGKSGRVEGTIALVVSPGGIPLKNGPAWTRTRSLR